MSSTLGLPFNPSQHGPQGQTVRALCCLGVPRGCAPYLFWYAAGQRPTKGKKTNQKKKKSPASSKSLEGLTDCSTLSAKELVGSAGHEPRMKMGGG